MPNTIADNLLRLQAARTDIANAITTMGGTVTSGDGFEDFSAEILGIPSGAEIYDISSPSGTTSCDLHMVYINGNIYVFGEYNAKSSKNVSSAAFIFPALSNMGITSSMTGYFINITSLNSLGIANGSFTTLTLTPDQSKSLTIANADTARTVRCVAILSPTT